MDSTTTYILHAILAESTPRSVFLFGSRARRDHRTDSDYDFYVVNDADARTNIDLWTLVTDRTADTDCNVIVKTAGESVGNAYCLFRKVLADGVTLHGDPPSEYEVPEGAARTSALYTLDFAESRLEAARRLAAPDLDGRYANAVTDLLLVSIARATDALLCDKGVLDVTTKRGTDYLALLADKHPPLAELAGAIRPTWQELDAPAGDDEPRGTTEHQEAVADWLNRLRKELA